MRISLRKKSVATDRTSALNADATLVTQPQRVASGDYDGDGMPDRWEYLYHLDLRAAADAQGNPDGDTLINALEYSHGRNPLVSDDPPPEDEPPLLPPEDPSATPHIMKLHLTYFVLFLILFKSISFAQSSADEDRLNNEPTANQIRDMSDWLVSKRRQYETMDSDLNAYDLKKIGDLSKSPALALTVIDDLIALAEVREPPPNTIGFFGARRVSPVVRVLVEIGNPAVPKINQALANKNLPIWSNLALKDALRIINGEGADFNEVLYADDPLVLPRKVREKAHAGNISNIESVKNKPSEARVISKASSETKTIAQQSESVAPKKAFELSISPWVWFGGIIIAIAVFIMNKK